MPSPSDISFEAAFFRLEEILEQMNSGNVPLEVSLKLYEEADLLINICQKRLNDAERKVELLIKQRNGELVVNSENRPLTQEMPFPSPP